MDKEDILIKIQNLYDSYQEETEKANDKRLADNLALGQKILEYTEDLLRQDPLDADAHIWKMKVFALEEFNDTNGIISSAEFILEQAEKFEDKLIGYNWLAWTYDVKLNLPEKALEIFEEKLLEINSNTTAKKSFIDIEYGETYYRMGYLQETKGDMEKAIDYYLLSYQYMPNHMRRNFFVGQILMERGLYADAAKMLYLHFYWTEDKYCVDYSKKIRELYEQGEDIGLELYQIFYFVSLAMPKDFGHKNSKEVFDYHQKFIKEQTEKNNPAVYDLLGYYYSLYEKNNKKTYEAYHKYLSHPGVTFYKSSTVNYFNSAEKLGKKVDLDFLQTNCHGGISYNIMTEFLEKSYKAYEQKNTELENYYLDIALKYGMDGYQKFDKYFSNEPDADPIHNDSHLFAMLCNNLGIVIYRKYFDSPLNIRKDWFKKSAEIHLKGYELSPFWENLDNAINCLIQSKNHLEILKIAPKWIEEVRENYTDRFGPDLVIRMYRNAIISAKETRQFELGENLYQQAHQYFLEVADETKDLIKEMLLLADNFFLYLLEKEEAEICLKQIDLFFQNEVYRSVLPYESSYLENEYKGRSLLKLEKYSEAKPYFEKLIALIEKNQKNDSSLDLYKEYLDTCNGQTHYEKKIRQTFSKFKLNLNQSKYNCNDSDENASWVKKICEGYTSRHENWINLWATPDYYVRVSNNIERRSDPKYTDDTIFIYVNEWKMGFYFERVSWVEEKKIFFGLSTKKVPYQWFGASYSTNVEPYTMEILDETVPYDKAPKDFKTKVLAVWNGLIEAIK